MTDDAFTIFGVWLTAMLMCSLWVVLPRIVLRFVTRGWF